MPPTGRRSSIALAATVLALLGAVDAAMSEEWDLAAVFVLLLVLGGVLLGQVRRSRPAVPIRRDLVQWLCEQATATGEPMERIVDRSVASYRAGLSADR